MLLGSNLLDFAIGLVVVYFLLALLCSWLNERLASALNLRAKTLEDGLEGLLGPDLAHALLNHPLVSGLSNQHGKNGDNATKPPDPKRSIINPRRYSTRLSYRVRSEKRTSYIDPRTFSTALIHHVWKLGVSRDAVAMVKRSIPAVSAGDFKTGLDVWLGGLGQQLKLNPADELQKQIEELYADLRTSLDSTLDATGREALAEAVPADGSLDTRLQNLREFVAGRPADEVKRMLTSFVNAIEIRITQAGASSASAENALRALRDLLATLPSNYNLQDVLAAIDRMPTPATPDNASGKPVIDLAAFRSSILLLPSSHARTALLSLVDAAQNGIGDAQSNIERWFNDAMERLSGWYKRRTQRVVLVMALVIAIVLNADSLAIGNSLWHNDAQRQLAVAEGQQVIGSINATPAAGGSQATSSPNPASFAALCATPTPSPTTAASSAAAATPTPSATPSPPAGSAGTLATATPVPATATLACINSKLQSLHLPIGYAMTDPGGHHVVLLTGPWFKLNVGTHVEDYLAKILGFIVTAVAISLGAPFWFDLLNKLVNLRNTGDPPKSSTSGASTPDAGNPQPRQS